MGLRKFAATLWLIALLLTSLPAAAVSDSPPDAQDEVRAALVETLIPLQDAIRAKHADSFGGLWIDDHGVTNVATVGEAQEITDLVVAARLTPRPVFHRVDFTEQYLDAVMQSVSQAVEARPDAKGGLDGVDFKLIAVSLPQNAIVVKYRLGSAAARAALRTRFGSAIVTETTTGFVTPAACLSRANCGSPVRAGLQLYWSGTQTQCASAFVIKDLVQPPNYFLLSAGHCWNANRPNRYHPAGTFLGSTAGRPHVVCCSVDAMVVPIPRTQASNLLYVASNFSRSVTSTESGEVIGENVCSSKISGISCGSLRSTNVCTEYGVCGQRLVDNTFACGGDSGSAAYATTGSSTAKAIGIMVAGTSGNHACPSGQDPSGPDSLYTHLKNALPALGRFSVVQSAP